MPKVATPKAPKIKILEPTREIRLDLASGQNPKDGFEGVDLFAPYAKHRVDLLQFPWPWADNSVSAIHCSHFIEHIPMVFIAPDNSVSPMPAHGQELFFRFFDEVYRILHKEGVATFIWPALQSVRAFQDPTHRRFIPGDTMWYLHKAWREANKLDHYNVKCNFEHTVSFSFGSDIAALHQDAQARRIREGWNTIIDFVGVLKPVK